MEDVGSHWTVLKHTWQESCNEVLGKGTETRKSGCRQKHGIWSPSKCFQAKIGRCNEQTKKSSLTSMHWQLNKDVRKSAKKDKKEFFNTLATEAESAGQRNITRTEVDSQTQLGATKALLSLQGKNKGQDGWNISETFSADHLPQKYQTSLLMKGLHSMWMSSHHLKLKLSKHWSSWIMGKQQVQMASPLSS